MRLLTMIFVLAMGFNFSYSQTAVINKKNLSIDGDKRTPKAVLENSDAVELSCSKFIFTVVEIMPVFDGGKKELLKYLQVNTTEDVGAVLVQFVIDCNGDVKKPTILRHHTESADETALELIKNMPKWQPGIQAGLRVNVKYRCRVNFKKK